MLRRIVIVTLLLVLGAVLVVRLAGKGFFGDHEGPGEPTAVARKDMAVRVEAQAAAATGIGVVPDKQILFGDLHVHTTFSFDAYMFSLPMLNGEGAHPPADACDFARWCSALDFWSINDHAENLTPRHWSETVESVRQCNAIGGEGENPDTVAYLGWEWTQVGTTPDNHYGHKNVVLAHTDDDRIPSRPIGAARPPSATYADSPIFGRGLAALAIRGRFLDYTRFVSESEGTPRCPRDIDVSALPEDCIELAEKPSDLYRKLDQWGHDSIVIPHGTTWGMYTPPGSSWDKQLVGDMHDEDRQTLMEVYSGHGDSEVYRDWRSVDLASDGSASCPEPSPGYLPSCWRAGQIIEQRCLDEGVAAPECAERAAVARANYVAAGLPGHLSVPGARAEEWLDSGQCRDCRQPSFNYRPASSAQYILALGNFDAGADSPRRFRMGFMASSDNHFARPGTGYKEVHRKGMTESIGATREADAGPLASALQPPKRDPVPYSVPFDREKSGISGFALFETERQASFLLTGGLIATHATGRDRASIWDAMQRREVYGTSGPRILLWFDLLNAPGTGGGTRPMGSEVEMGEAPIFQVRAVGSFEQRPGCPERTQTVLGAEEMERICMGECYHPSDRRRPITRIEVIKVTPQRVAGEDVAGLIADPWKSFACDPDPSGCAVSFSDPDYATAGREAVFYVRAFEAPKPGVNAQNLRCERDQDGECISVDLCPGPEGLEDDCLAPHEPRAWSSPIWLDPPRTSSMAHR